MTPPPSIDQSVTALHRFGKQLARPLARLGLATVADLLAHMPVRHDDLRTVTPIRAVRAEGRVVVRGRIVQIANRVTPRRRVALTEALIRDATGSIRCVWFRQPYLAHAFPSGTDALVVGDPAQDAYGLHLPSPIIERDTAANLHAGRLVPVYPLTAGITGKQLRFLIHCALPALAATSDPLPEHIRTREGLCRLLDARRSIHFPEDVRTLAAARERLAFDELLAYTARIRASRTELAEANAVRIPCDPASVQACTAALPFALTRAQERAVGEILADIASPPPSGAGEQTRPMHRLLNGDVGSGKTAVAGIVAGVVARAGFQAVYLAPTEVLAQQQAAVLTRWLAPIGVTVGCWTRTTRQCNGEDVPLRRIRAAVADGSVRVVVGTHALLTPTVQFAHLALAVVDEQHRFGVAQRAALRRKTDGALPHLLSMTATPIPRTLQLTLLGDLRVSLLDERPAAREPVRTVVVPPEERLAMTRAVKRELADGRQAFIVCPRIDAEEDGSAAVTEALDRAHRAFPDATIAALHGRLSALEQRRILEEFTAQRTNVLLATTVIEVGVDQPNATVMLIEDAERFGLAQLHQLRGRVGRGDHPGTCYLTTRSTSPSARDRLARVAATTDGFALAELDLAERGPGAVFGTAQSGWPELHFARFDAAFVARVQRVADEMGSALAPTEERAHLE